MKVSMHNKARRQNGARARFSIMSKQAWIEANGKKNKVTPLGDEAYASYVERKNQERIALAIANNELQVR